MKDFFKLEELKTDVYTETMAGITTFVTMAYIIIVNPSILSAAGVPFDQVFIATIASAVVGTLIMAFFANYPIAIAPGMGMNAYFASVVAVQGVSYQTVLGAVFFASVLFLLLAFTKFRELLLDSIPVPLKIGITAGIGLFIAFLGLRMSGIVVPDEGTYVAFGDVTTPMTALAIFGIFLTLILTARNVRGELFIGMFVTAVIAYFLGMLEVDGIMSLPPSPVFFDFDLAGVFTHGLYGVVFAFLLVTIFDTTGTMIGVAEQAGLMKDGHLPKASAALTADAVASTVGASLGSTPSSAYVESSSGVAAGGRTGLTSVVVAILFIFALFFSPIVAAIADVPAITAPALIIVGSYMMNGLAKVRWDEFDEAFPTFAIILTMPLTSSIATGIAMGFIIYPLLKVASGKAKTVPAIIYLFGIIFVVQLVFFPMH